MQSKLPSESKTLIEIISVINLMNPQKLNNTYCGDLVGSAEYLHTKPRGYNCHVHCTRIQSMGRTQKLQNDVERTGVEKNL